MSRSEIVVIGAGSVGANVAYRLAQRGAQVTVLDANAPGTGTSGTSFAWTNALSKQPENYHGLNTAGMRGHLAITEELGGDWHKQHGGIHWRDTPEAQATLRNTVARAQGWDYPVEMLTPRAAREIEPDLNIPDEVGEVFFCPSEGYVEAVPFIAALLAAARRYGATVLSHQRVTSILRDGDRVRGVVTQDGTEHLADVVVDCAGPAMDEVARLAGVEMPFNRVPGRLLYTTPVATTLKRIVYGPLGHFRPDGAGRIVLSHGEHDHDIDSSKDTLNAEASLAAITQHLPALAGARIEAVRIGVRPMPKDEKPMVGSIPGLEGFYVVVSHSGITMGPLWGQVAASELLDGTPDPRLAPFRPARFLVPA
jgi:glycine/D-amino acid oxidase-like deaminating enzyme